MENQNINNDLKVNNGKSMINVIGLGRSGNNILKNLYANSLIANYLLLTNNKNHINEVEKTINTFFFDDSNNEFILSNENKNWIIEYINNSKFLICTFGLGGKFFFDCIDFITNIAKKHNVITIAIVTLPFSFEGNQRRENSQKWLEKIKDNFDDYIVISNDKILNNFPDVAISDVYQLTNNAIKNCVNTFISFWANSSIINIEQEEIINALKNKKEIYIGFGSGIGKRKINKAVESSINSKIITSKLKDFENILVKIVADSTVSIQQVNEIIDLFKLKINKKELNILFSFDINKSFRNEIQINIIASKKNIENDLFNNSVDYDIQQTRMKLTRIGDTLEHEITSERIISINSNDFEAKSHLYDNDRENEKSFIQFEEDEDIPFFLK